MEHVVPFLTDTNGPYKQLLAAEQTAQSLQAWIQEKKDAIRSIKQQAVDQDLPRDAIYVNIRLLEVDIGGFKRLLKSNEASLCLWRRLHMAARRATVRRLKVVDLPNEILTKVFANFEDVPVPQTQIEDLPLDAPLPSPDLASIKNIRLTCRAFCDNGSKFLLPVVNISFSQSSLQRLEEISSHPTISKGVRIIRIHTNKYNDLLANNRDKFCVIAYREINDIKRNLIIGERMTGQQVVEDCHLIGLKPKPKFLKVRGLDMALKEAEDLLVTVNAYRLRDIQAPGSLDRFETKITKAIEQAHKEYRQRYIEQMKLAYDCRAYANISTALSQMPCVERLCIVKQSCGPGYGIWSSGWDNRLDAQKCKSILEGPNPFWDMMLQAPAGPSTLLDWNVDTAFSLVLKYPLLLRAGNANLTHLDIDVPLVDGDQMEIGAEDLQNIRHACQQLKFVRLRVLQRYLMQSLSGLPATYTMFESILASPRLEVFRLVLPAPITRGAFDSSASVGPLLASLSCNKLRNVCLDNFPVKIEELRQFLDKVPGQLHLNLTGIYLLDGTWAEALELLRGRVDSSSRVVKPRGVEIEALSEQEAKYLRHEFDSEHRDNWYSAQRCPGPASLYIRGGNIPNPLVWGSD